MLAPPPNLLWIVTTQWRGMTMGCAGDPDACTPALDAFARDAVVFTQAFSNHPFGPFARALLFTGELSPKNGVSDYWDPLPRTAETIAQRLAGAGYDTAFFGKWHLARRDPTAPVVGEAHARMIVPLEDRGGFAFWEGFESGFVLNDPWLHGNRLPEPTRFAGYQSDVLCTRAAEWLSARQSSADAARPQFTVVSLEAPHPPYAAATPPDIEARDPATLTLPPNVPRGGELEENVRRELAGYLRHIEATDRALGHLLATIDPASTAVFITSVHGDMHGAHGLLRKGWPYDESLRVPLLARWPGSTPTQVRTPASLADLPATALALAGIETPSGWTGADLRALPTDAEREIAISMPSAPPFANQCPHPWHGVRSRDELRTFRADGQPWLRFDLRSDPWQQHNLVG